MVVVPGSHPPSGPDRSDYDAAATKYQNIVVTLVPTLDGNSKYMLLTCVSISKLPSNLNTDIYIFKALYPVFDATFYYLLYPLFRFFPTLI